MSAGKSRADLEKFLDWVANKGLIPPNKVTYIASAARVVFSILDAQEAADVTALNFDSVFQRFTNLKAQGYTPESLKAYRLRSRTALLEFSSWLKDPVNYKPNTATKAFNASAKPPSEGDPSKKSKKTRGREQAKTVTPPAPAHPAPPAGISTHTITVPLREGLTLAVHNVPYDLTANEAKKINTIISAYASEGDGLK